MLCSPRTIVLSVVRPAYNAYVCLCMHTQFVCACTEHRNSNKQCLCSCLNCVCHCIWTLAPTMVFWFSMHYTMEHTLHAYTLDHFDLWPDELLFKCANKSIKGICGQFTCLRFQFFSWIDDNIPITIRNTTQHNTNDHCSLRMNGRKSTLDKCIRLGHSHMTELGFLSHFIHHW